MLNIGHKQARGLHVADINKNISDGIFHDVALDVIKASLTFKMSDDIALTRKSKR
jgi:hypothetical protein